MPSSSEAELIDKARAKVRVAHDQYARAIAIRSGDMDPDDEGHPDDEHYDEAAEKLKVLL